jgi:hypothetical protein
MPLLAAFYAVGPALAVRCSESILGRGRGARVFGNEPTGNHGRDSVWFLRSRLPRCYRSNRGVGDAGYSKDRVSGHHGRSRSCRAHHATERLRGDAVAIPGPQWRLHHEYWVEVQSFASCRCHGKRARAKRTFQARVTAWLTRTSFRASWPTCGSSIPSCPSGQREVRVGSAADGATATTSKKETRR